MSTPSSSSQPKPASSQRGERVDAKHSGSMDIEPANRERFKALADRWEIETVFLSNSDRAAAHPAHQEIVSMGERAVPLILERMRSQGGLWFHALRHLTGANPVAPEDRGKTDAMQTSWLQWGERNGYA